HQAAARRRVIEVLLGLDRGQGSNARNRQLAPKVECQRVKADTANRRPIRIELNVVLQKETRLLLAKHRKIGLENREAGRVRQNRRADIDRVEVEATDELRVGVKVSVFHAEHGPVPNLAGVKVAAQIGSHRLRLLVLEWNRGVRLIKIRP